MLHVLALFAPIRHVDRAVTGGSTDKADQPFRGYSGVVAGGFGPTLFGIEAFLNVVRRMVHVSIPTASRVLWGFVSAVVNMRNNYIVWPTTPEAIRRAKQGFYALNSEYPSPVFVKYP